MKHIFFIDPLEKLNIKKDSSLMMALTMQSLGAEVYLLFEEDFYLDNYQGQSELRCHHFSGNFKEDGYYLASISLEKSKNIAIDSNCMLHMRIDPPFDTRYLRYLWMLDGLSKKTGCRVVNNPLGIMKYNEKLAAYSAPGAVHSYVGSSLVGLQSFVKKLSATGAKEVILKPLDLYSGIGVEKLEINSELENIFQARVAKYQGAIVVQPFLKEVFSGELRSIFLDGKEIGTIIKRPPEGQFLANIAQGAAFERAELSSEVSKACADVANMMLADGVRLVAFDILAGSINEVNVTCPGLMVEVSKAMGQNLCALYYQALSK